MAIAFRLGTAPATRGEITVTPKLWQGLLIGLLAIPQSSGALAANAPVISVPFVTAVVGQTVTIPVLITNAS